MAKKLLGAVVGFLWDILSLSTAITLVMLFVALMIGGLNKLGWTFVTVQDLAQIPYIGHILIFGVISWLGLMLLGALIMFRGALSGHN